MEMLNFKNAMIGAFLFASMGATAQTGLQPELQNYRMPGYDGLNVFEQKKDDVPFEGLKVRVGGDFAIQFQGLNQSNAADSNVNSVPYLIELGNNFNLPTANLNLDVQLADGLLMHLRTYLSSRHHPEAWVKGGHLKIDKLDFIKKDLLSNLMEFTTITVGLDEINYGDAHFRRSDNARAIYNPFVGNYIMDSFTTEAFAEFTFQPKDFIIVAGISNGKLNQSPAKGTYDYTPAFYGKLGWDSQINDDTRLRITGSIYTKGNYNRSYLYGGDRAGSRYYDVMWTDKYESDFSGRFNPGFTKFTSFQINPFVKFKGLEFFGVFEMTNGDKKEYVLDVTGAEPNGAKEDINGGGYTQIGAEVLYRFGSWEQFYVGGRYNSVSGKASEAAMSTNISRINAGLGWFMTKNVLAKLEYVTQSYSGEGFDGTNFQDGNFNGIMLEAVIGF